MRRQLPLCVAACFLLSTFLISCQTAHKAGYNAKTTGSASGKNGEGKDKSTAIHKKITGTSKYYSINHYPVKKTPAASIPAVAFAQPAQKVSPENTRIVSTLNTPPAIVNKTEEKVNTENTKQVTIIIRDSVAQADAKTAVITKPDTIQFREPNKDEVSEADQAAGEEVMPLTPEEIDTVLSKYAEMISINRSEISNFNLYFFIDEWYGTPYKWGGVDSSGIDCSAFCQKLYGKVYGVDILRTAREQRKHSEHIKYPDETNEGDLVFFRINHLRVSHVGIYLANGYFVHSSRSKGVVISNLNNKYWHRRFAGCGRIPREEKSILESDYVQ